MTASPVGRVRRPPGAARLAVALIQGAAAGALLAMVIVRFF